MITINDALAESMARKQRAGVPAVARLEAAQVQARHAIGGWIDLVPIARDAAPADAAIIDGSAWVAVINASLSGDPTRRLLLTASGWRLLPS